MFSIESNSDWQITFAQNLMNYESIYCNLLEHKELIGNWVVVHQEHIRFFGPGPSGFDAAKSEIRTILQHTKTVGGPLMICIGWEHLNLDDPALDLPLFDESGVSFSFLGDIVTKRPDGSLKAKVDYFGAHEGKIISINSFRDMMKKISKTWNSTKIPNSVFHREHIGGATRSRLFCTLYASNSAEPKMVVPITCFVDCGCPFPCIQKCVWDQLQCPYNKNEGNDIYKEDGHLYINKKLFKCKVIDTYSAPETSLGYTAYPDSKMVAINLIGLSSLFEMGLIVGNKSLIDSLEKSADNEETPKDKGETLVFCNEQYTRKLEVGNEDFETDVPKVYLPKPKDDDEDMWTELGETVVYQCECPNLSAEDLRIRYSLAQNNRHTFQIESKKLETPFKVSITLPHREDLAPFEFKKCVNNGVLTLTVPIKQTVWE